MVMYGGVDFHVDFLAPVADVTAYSYAASRGFKPFVSW